MRILVTGGAGFIGSYVADAYIADGHDVVIVDDLSTGRRENLNPRAKFYEADICGPRVAEVFERERPDVLCHHAAQIDVRVSVSDPQRDLKANVGGLIALLEAGRRRGLKKVIFASSGGAAYGEQEAFPATEDHPTRPLSPYGIDKLASEHYLRFYRQEHGIEWVALRYANIYGPRQDPHGEAGVVAIFIRKMLTSEVPVINGDGGQTRDYVYVGDAVEANRLSLGEEASGAYNVGTGVETDVNALFRALRELTGSHCEERHGPAKPGEQRRSAISAMRIERELGWRPRVRLAEGLGRTVEWFSKGGPRDIGQVLNYEAPRE